MDLVDLSVFDYYHSYCLWDGGNDELRVFGLKRPDRIDECDCKRGLVTNAVQVLPCFHLQLQSNGTLVLEHPDYVQYLDITQNLKLVQVLPTPRQDLIQLGSQFSFSPGFLLNQDSQKCIAAPPHLLTAWAIQGQTLVLGFSTGLVQLFEEQTSKELSVMKRYRAISALDLVQAGSAVYLVIGDVSG